MYATMQHAWASDEYFFMLKLPKFFFKSCRVGLLLFGWLTVPCPNAKNAWCNKRCEATGCDKFPAYGLPGGKRARCKPHLLPGMVNVMKSKECEDGTCIKNPCYGLVGGEAVRCKIHALTGMIDVTHPRCEANGCEKRPSYGVLGGKPTRCKSHMLANMTDVNNVCKCCVTCATTRAIKTRFLGRCFRCFVYEFPQNPLVRNYKTKEAATIAFLREHFSTFDMREDKKVPDGCSKYRPDLIFDLGDRVIIVEIDEHQHRDYETLCEIRRSMALFVDVNGKDCLKVEDADREPAERVGRPVVLIRFNPDEYVPKASPEDQGQAKSVPSCWKRTPKTELLSVRDDKAWADRLEVLRSSIDFHATAPVESLKEVHEVKLFYDENF